MTTTALERRSDARLLLDAWNADDVDGPPTYDPALGKAVLDNIDWNMTQSPRAARLRVGDRGDEERELTEAEWEARVWLFGPPEPFRPSFEGQRYHLGMMPKYILVHPDAALTRADGCPIPAARLVIDGCSVRDLLGHVADMTDPDMEDHVIFGGVRPLLPAARQDRVVMVAYES